MIARTHLRLNPDLTLKEHCEAFEEQTGVAISEATMSRSISRLSGGWPLKKDQGSFRTRRRSEGPAAMVGFSLRRQAPCVRGRERDAYLDGSLEVSGSEGRAYGRVPKNRGKNLTLIASMSL